MRRYRTGPLLQCSPVWSPGTGMYSSIPLEAPRLLQVCLANQENYIYFSSLLQTFFPILTFNPLYT